MRMTIREANRLFEAGQFEAARDAYSSICIEHEKTDFPRVLIEHCRRRVSSINQLLSIAQLERNEGGRFEVDRSESNEVGDVTPSTNCTPSSPETEKSFRICLFADSRGAFKHTGFDGKLFTELLADRFHVDVYCQPLKWTTLIDFTGLVADGVIDVKRYDLIIVWAGIVDFSPRPLSQHYQGLYTSQDRNMMHVAPNKKYRYQRSINEKSRYLSYMEPNSAILRNFHSVGLDVYYGGEKTSPLYPESFLQDVANYLNAVPNLVYIDSCRVLPDWDGDFTKGRPRNIDLISRYSELLTSRLKNVVRISNWTDDQIKTFTTDNLHLTARGSNHLYNLLDCQIAKALETHPKPKLKPRQRKNIVVTSADSSFFSSLLLLIRSLLARSSHCVDEVLVFDVGLEPWQVALLASIESVKTFNYDLRDRIDLERLHFDFFDSATYGFKAYALARCHRAFKPGDEEDQANCLYIDSGICIDRDISEIFGVIDQDDIFCVDHEDCHDYYGDSAFMLLHILSPSLFGIRNGIKFDLLSEEKLAKPYIKAGFFGYKRNGRFQTLIDEHYELCTKTDVLTQPKSVLDSSARMWYRNNTAIGRYCKENSINFSSLDYQNGRQDQTSLSYLVAKYDVPVQNSRRFNYTRSASLSKEHWYAFGDRLQGKFDIFKDDIDRTLKIARRETSNKSRPDVIREYLDVMWAANESSDRKTPAIPLPRSILSNKALTTLHRGSMARPDEWKYSGALLNHYKNRHNSDIFILLGNGPSLADVDLKSLSGHATFGLNAAYRAYERIGFWPTYFGCFDSLVCAHHAKSFEQLVITSPIKKFFFINFNEQKKPIFTDKKILDHERFQKINFIARTPSEKEQDDIIATQFDNFIDMLTSGTNSIQCALLMGYRKIILLGCDANYVEIVDGAKQESNRNKLVMEKTPSSNPNYWFSDYQIEGDKFNLPNLSGCQLPAWGRLANTIKSIGINAEIINCSPISQIEDFKKMALPDALDYFQSY